MKLKFNQPKASAERVVQDIRRATRRHYSTEDKIRIVHSGLRGEDRVLLHSSITGKWREDLTLPSVIAILKIVCLQMV